MNTRVQIEKFFFIFNERLGAFLSGHFISCFCGLLFFIFVFPLTASAQQPQGSSISVSVDRDHVRIGEPIDLYIEVKTGAGSRITQWVNLPDSFHRLEVLNRLPIDSVVEASKITYHQHFTITGFEPGVWIIPSLHATINKKSISSNPVTITIVPVPLKDSTYHDIREIMDVPVEENTWWYWLAGILSALLLGVLVVLWIRSRTVKSLVNSPESSLPPLREAMDALRRLETEKLVEKKEWKKYYSTLTRILKRYIERKFGVSAMQHTTAEVLLLLKQLPGSAVGDAAAVLRMADAVKFARFEPGKEEADVSLQQAEQTIQLLDQKKS